MEQISVKLGNNIDNIIIFILNTPKIQAEVECRAVIVIRIVSFLSHANVFCQSIRISYTLLHKTRIVLQDLARVVQNEQNAATLNNLKQGLVCDKGTKLLRGAMACIKTRD